MIRNHVILVVSSLLLPIAIEAPPTPPDSSNTRISVAGGIGAYAVIIRGCEGQVLSARQVGFDDAGLAIEHKFANPVKIGVRSGTVQEAGLESNAYLNSHLALEWRSFGIGAGVLRSQEDFAMTHFGKSNLGYTGHLRFGRQDGTNFSIEINEGMPLYSGGGRSALGVGFRPHPNVRGWAGVNSGPFDGIGFAVRSEVRVAPRWFVNTTARIGGAGSRTEGGISLGIAYQIPGRANPTGGRPAARGP